MHFWNELSRTRTLLILAPSTPPFLRKPTASASNLQLENSTSSIGPGRKSSQWRRITALSMRRVIEPESHWSVVGDYIEVAAVRSRQVIRDCSRIIGHDVKCCAGV